jgi:RNA polymerase sigma-70 factor (ECF subfamily)
VNSHELYRLYRDGRSDAATAIFDRYVARLIALVRGRVGAKLQRRVDAEDVVQSAYRSFFVHARGDGYEIAKSGDLWRLLAGIALNKLYGQIETHTAAKRSIRREDAALAAAASVEAPEPSAQEAAAIIEELQLILSDLTTEERSALASRLQGLSIEEIGASIGKSQRTIRRLLGRQSGPSNGVGRVNLRRTRCKIHRRLSKALCSASPISFWSGCSDPERWERSTALGTSDPATSLR